MEEEKYRIEDLKLINYTINEILNLSFEDLSYVLSEKDKENIDNYFSKFYSKSMENIIGNEEMQDLVRTLNKISFYGIPGKIEDKKYLSQFINDEDLRDKIEQNIDIEQVESGNIPNVQELENILILLANINDDKLTPAFQAGMKGLQKKGIDIYHSKAMDEYLRKLTLFFIYLQKDLGEFDRNNIPFMYDYIDNITKSKDFNIFKEQRVSDILQLVYANRLPKDIIEKVKEILDKNLEISKINIPEVQKNIEDFLTQNKGQVITDEKVFDEFLHNVQKFKLGKSLKVDNKVIEFIMSQVMDVNSVIFKNQEKYQCVVERTLEDLGKNDLPSKVSKDKGYVYFIWDSFNQQKTVGSHLDSQKAILVKRKIVEHLLKNKDLNVLDTIFHENTHAVQEYDIENGKYENYLRYLMTKEIIMQKFNPNYYQANYAYIFIEIEARENSAKKLGNFLGKIMPSTNKQAIYRSVLRKDISKFLKDLA